MKLMNYFLINQLMRAEHRGIQNAHGADSGLHMANHNQYKYLYCQDMRVSEWGEEVVVWCMMRACTHTHTHTVTECSLLVEAHYCTEGHCSHICNLLRTARCGKKIPSSNTSDQRRLFQQTSPSPAFEPQHSLILLPTPSSHSVTHKTHNSGPRLH